jgi:hypothetical protein
MKEFPDLQDSFSTRLAYHVLDPIPPLLATALQPIYCQGRCAHRFSRQFSSSRGNSNPTVYIRLRSTKRKEAQCGRSYCENFEIGSLERWGASLVINTEYACRHYIIYSDVFGYGSLVIALASFQRSLGRDSTADLFVPNNLFTIIEFIDQSPIPLTVESSVLLQHATN